MHILIVADVDDWAIANMTQAIVQDNPQHTFHVVYAHPKRVIDAVSEVQHILRTYPIALWHAMYWNSGVQMLELCSELKKIPSVLTHHNHRNLNEQDWSMFDALTIQTKYGAEKLAEKHGNVWHIPHSIDLEEYTYNEEREDDGNTVGYVGRVIPHKNLGPITRAAKSIGAKVLGSGYIDDEKYYRDEVDASCLTFIGGKGRSNKNSMESKNDLYAQMTVFVMYSTQEYETGTIPLLEAMAKGVPVMATAQGSARDLIEDGVNGIIFTPENFEEKLQTLLWDRGLQETLRRNARNTIQSYHTGYASRMYEKLYRQIVHDDTPLVSIVTPIYNAEEWIDEVIDRVAAQTYKNIELILIDDNSTDGTFAKIEDAMKRHDSIAIRLEKTNAHHKIYGLARARNIGVLEARGEYIAFIDSRFGLEPDAIERFMAARQPHTWLHGAKVLDGEVSTKKGFVENMSFVARRDIVRIGMFNELLEMYGGMTQDVRERIRLNNMYIQHVPNARAVVLKNTGKFKYPNEIWKAKYIVNRLYEA